MAHEDEILAVLRDIRRILDERLPPAAQTISIGLRRPAGTETVELPRREPAKTLIVR